MPAFNEAAKGFSREVARRMSPIWHMVVDPLDNVLDPAQRRQALLLNYMLIPVFACLAFLMLWGSFRNAVAYLGIDLVALGAIYLLNRIGLYQPAAIMLSLVVSISAFGSTILYANTGTLAAPEVTLMWIIPAVLLAHLLLPLRSTVFLLYANLIAILLVPILSPLPYNAIIPAFYFTIVVSLLMLLATIIRSRYMAQIERQARELGESEARFRNLLEASFETIIVLKDGMILDSNPSIQALLGYQPSDIIGKSILDFVEAPYHRRVIASYQSDSAEPYQALLRHKDSTALHVELRGKTQLYKGQLVQVVAVRDITELKNQEALTIEREKVRVLQKFIGNLSHDLRTPLTVINTSIYLINRMAQEPERQHQQIEVLHEQAANMQRMLEDLISMSRLDKADTSDFKYGWVDVNEPVIQAIKDHQNLANRKKQNLAQNLTENLPVVLLDVDQFQLAVKHLILNGLSYSPEGGTVTVATSATPSNVVVQVSDTGRGIDPSDLPHIFEHFYRADPARGGEDGGTGVGLTIAKKIIEAHGGSIQVESQPGQGSKFNILLPIQQAQSAS